MPSLVYRLLRQERRRNVECVNRWLVCDLVKTNSTIEDVSDFTLTLGAILAGVRD
jgi:hypothetical protein